MYIVNPQSIKKETFKCNQIVGRYLVDEGLSLLSRRDGVWEFARTDLLSQVLSGAPIWIKLFAHETKPKEDKTEDGKKDKVRGKRHPS